MIRFAHDGMPSLALRCRAHPVESAPIGLDQLLLPFRTLQVQPYHADRYPVKLTRFAGHRADYSPRELRSLAIRYFVMVQPYHADRYSVKLETHPIRRTPCRLLAA
jgi:hypothetical protein